MLRIFSDKLPFFTKQPVSSVSYIFNAALSVYWLSGLCPHAMSKNFQYTLFIKKKRKKNLQAFYLPWRKTLYLGVAPQIFVAVSARDVTQNNSGRAVKQD